MQSLCPHQALGSWDNFSIIVKNDDIYCTFKFFYELLLLDIANLNFTQNSSKFEAPTSKNNLSASLTWQFNHMRCNFFSDVLKLILHRVSVCPT